MLGLSLSTRAISVALRDPVRHLICFFSLVFSSQVSTCPRSRLRAEGPILSWRVALLLRLHPSSLQGYDEMLLALRQFKISLKVLSSTIDLLRKEKEWIGPKLYNGNNIILEIKKKQKNKKHFGYSSFGSENVKIVKVKM